MMRLATRLTAAQLAAMCFILGMYGMLRVQAEISTLEKDSRRDHLAMGYSLGVATERVWNLGGQRAASDLVEEANRRREGVTIRLLARAEAAGPARAAAAPTSAPDSGNQWVAAAGEGGRVLYTHLPVMVQGIQRGTIELAEPLIVEQNVVRSIALRMLATTGTLAVTSSLVAMGLSVWLIRTPIEALIEKAQRSGRGDFSGPLQLRQSREFAALSAAFNSMCDQLAGAHRRIQSESAARITALEQLRHADRLATIGRIASGVAHELGTPLNVVTIRAKMIATGEVEGAEARESARAIMEQGGRMERLIRQLLTFARLRDSKRERVDLGVLARQVLSLLGPIAHSRNIALQVEGDEESIAVEAAADQLLQVLFNLVMNGIQAMPSGGTLSIRLERERVQPPLEHGGPAGEYVHVSVEDEGVGIPPDHLQQLFRPFFTTKPDGEGTGLGLSVSEGIVHEHGGWMTVSSQVGKGSRFSAYLPQTSDA